MKGSTRNGQSGRGSAGGTIDLGREPPLSVDQREGVPQRRSVSVRWLAGTVLTGLTSIGLMGGALTVALDGRHQLAFPPEARRLIAEAEAAFGHKGDRIRPVHEQIADRQVIQVSTVSRQGDRDLIKMKPFAKITTTLATAIGDLGDNIPKFDPAKIAASDGGDDPAAVPDAAPAATDKPGVVSDEGASGDVDTADGGPDPNGDGGSGDDVPDQTAAAAVGGPAPPGSDQDQIYGANVDGEVSVKVMPFPIGEPAAQGDPVLTTAEAEELVRNAARYKPLDGMAVAAMSFVDPDSVAAGASQPDPFAALGVRIVPENVSFVSKTSVASASDEKIATVDKRQPLDHTLMDNGVDQADATNIVQAMSQLLDLSSLHSGQKVRILFTADGEGEKAIRVSVYDQGVHQATVARRDDDSFVRADEPDTSTDEFDTADQPAPITNDLPKLYDSLYATALQQKVPAPLITDLMRIFSYDVDLQAPISPGDTLEVFHSLPEVGGNDDGDEILYAALTIDGVTKRYYRYRSPDDGVVDYFDEEGRSAKKFLVRKPMNAGIVTSPFGWRHHPLLGINRLHPGVDWGAPRGTPITAAGNGIVEKAGWSNGYGNFTLIRHTNGYETAYGHQSAIVKSIRPGVRVRQGELIGYVGSTGLSTGPHLHYEVRINGKPVDPLRVRLPRGRVLQGDILTAFQQEKSRIDTLLGTPAGAKVAALNTDTMEQ